MRTLPANFKQVGDLNEIIFANRNKSYGAYELRTHYNDRLLKAFLIAVSSLTLLLLVSFAMHRKPPQGKGDPFVTDTITTEIFTLDEKKHRETRHIEHSTDLPPTLIVNDTASESKEKHDSINIETASNNATIHGDSGLVGDNTVTHAIAVDTMSTGKTVEPSVMVISEVMPSFPGGNKAFSRYIQNHFDCGDGYISGEAKIVLRFVVMKDGSIARVEVLRNNAGIDCVNEAMNLLLNSPKWNPGLQNNQPVNVMMVLPITIQKQK